MKSEKSTAFISYLGILGLLIAYLNNKQLRSDFVSFHIRQSLGLSIGFFMLGYTVGNFDNWTVTLAFWTAFIVLNIYGIATALTGSVTAVPLFGKFFQKIFKNIS